MLTSFISYLNESVARLQVVQTKFVDELIKIFQHSGESMEIDALRNNAEHIYWPIIPHVDPTRDYKYVQWIANNWLRQAKEAGHNYAVIFQQDAPRIRAALELFDRIKHLMPPERRDIGQYKSFNSLEDAVQPWSATKTAGEIKRDEVARWKSDIQTIYSGPDGMILVPKTEDASRYLGRGTRWCTAYTDRSTFFNTYNKDGPLYILITPDGTKYQIHLPTNQWMNAGDNDARHLIVKTSLYRHMLPIIAAQCLKEVKAATSALELRDALIHYPAPILTTPEIVKIGADMLIKFVKETSPERGNRYSARYDTVGALYTLMKLLASDQRVNALREERTKILLDPATSTSAGREEFWYHIATAELTPEQKNLIVACYTELAKKIDLSSDDARDLFRLAEGKSAEFTKLFAPVMAVRSQVLYDYIKKAVRNKSTMQHVRSMEQQLSVLFSKGFMPNALKTLIADESAQHEMNYGLLRYFTFKKIDPTNRIGPYAGREMEILAMMFPGGIYHVDSTYNDKVWKLNDDTAFYVGIDVNFLSPGIKEKYVKTLRRHFANVIKFFKDARKEVMFIDNIDDIIQLFRWGHMLKVNDFVPEISQYYGWLYHYCNEYMYKVYNHWPEEKKDKYDNREFMNIVEKVMKNLINSIKAD